MSSADLVSSCPQQKECLEGARLYISCALGAAALVGLQLFLASPIKSTFAWVSHTTVGLMPLALLVWVTLATNVRRDGLIAKDADTLEDLTDVRVAADPSGAHLRSSSAAARPVV